MTEPVSSQGISDKDLEIQKEKELKLFFEIKDYEDKVIYTTNIEELKEILTQILLTGSYTKTFDIFKNLLSLTYQTISDKERLSGYELIRLFSETNKETSRAILDTYSKNVNIALQLVRIKIKDNTTNITQGSLEERIELIADLPEDQTRIISKYLMVFAMLTSKAFSSEEVLKNF